MGWKILPEVGELSFKKSPLARLVQFWWALAMIVLAVALLLPATALAAPPSPPFNECPPVGADTSCRILIVLNADGTTTILTDATQGPFDGIEDTLVGVLNNTGVTVYHVNLSSNIAIFGFDGDGSPPGLNNYAGPSTA